MNVRKSIFVFDDKFEWVLKFEDFIILIFHANHFTFLDGI